MAITAPPETVTVNAQVPQQPSTTPVDPSDSISLSDPSQQPDDQTGTSNPPNEQITTSGTPPADTPQPQQTQPNASPQGQQPQQMPQMPQGPPAPKGVDPSSPHADNPLVQKAGIMHTVMQALAGGPRFTYKVDPNTGQIQKTQVQMSKTDMGMAIALEAISGGLAGLAAQGPSRLGKAGLLGLQQGQQIAEKNQQYDAQQQQNANQDYARHAQILETNLRMYANAQQAGRQDQEGNQKYVDSYKELNDLIDKQYPGASKGIINYADLAKYHVTKDSVIPYKMVPRPDPSNPGQQAKNQYGVPQWDLQYRVIDPNFKGAGVITDQMKKLGARYNIQGLVDSDGNASNLPQDLMAKLSMAANFNAQVGAMQLFEHDLGKYYERLHKDDNTPGTGDPNGPVFKMLGSPEKLADFITNHEGGKPGDRNVRNNNPGNLVADASWTGPKDATKLPDGQAPFRVYSSPEEGRTALLNQIKLEQARNPNMTAQQFFSKYDPKGADDYVQAAIKAAGTPGGTGPSSAPDPVDVSTMAKLHPLLAKAVTDFQGYQSKTGNMADAIDAFRKDNAQEADLITQMYGGRHAIESYDDARVSDAQDVKDEHTIKKQAAIAAAKQAAASQEQEEMLKIPDGFTLPPNFSDLGSQEQKAYLTSKGVKVPARFDDLKAIADYDVPITSDSAKTWLTGNAKEMDQQTAVQYIKSFLNPNYNQAHYNDVQKTHAEFVNGKPGDQVTSFNTLLDHTGAAIDANNDYRRNGKGELLNKPLSWWGQNLSGDPALAQLQAAIEPVKSEFFTFLSNNHALTDHDKNAGDNILNWNMSPAVLESQLKAFAQTAAYRLLENNQRWTRTFGPGHNLPGLISPEALNGITKLTNSDGTNPVAELLKNMDTGGSLDGGIKGTMGQTVAQALHRNAQLQAPSYSFFTPDHKMGYNPATRSWEQIGTQQQ